jgi:hypothetical protein
MSHAAHHRPGVARPRRPRALASLALLVRVALRRRSLDRLLAAGADPSWAADLELRAAQLTRWRTRHALAQNLEHTIDEAQRPPRWSCAAPIDRPAVRAAAPELLALAARLEAEAPPAPEGIALAEQLVEDGSSPLYAPGDERALREGAKLARMALR